MNLKLRFALLFTLFVAVILISSSIIIYILYYNNRESEFFERVKIEALEFYNTISGTTDPGELNSKMLVKVLHSSTLYDERLMILDSNGNVIRKIPDTITITLTKGILSKIKKQEELLWYSENNYQNFATYLKNKNEIIMASGFDQSGLQKLYNLKIILAFVFVGGLLVTAFVSFFFVREAFSPLTKLSLQMKETTLQNLTRRIEVKETRDEINQIAKNFNGMLERLNKAYEFQKNFVYYASHELRTPLATMLSQTESALNKELSDTEYKKILISLQEEQQELIELTNSLLLISQYEQMGFVQEWPSLRIDEILYETVSHSKRMYPDLVVNIGFGGLPENDNDFIIQGNETLLKSAYNNLLKNAYLYSADRKINITIEQDGDHILVHIDNKGQQLGSAEIEKVQVPFFRGENALKEKGYGLGLAIVHRIIFIHKGQVIYTALPDNINRFTVSLVKAVVV